MIKKFSNCYNIETSKILYLDELEQKSTDRKLILKENLEYYIEKEKTTKKLYNYRSKYTIIIMYSVFFYNILTSCLRV